MAAFFSNLRNTVIAGFALSFVVFLIDALKGGVSRFIAPAALFWFRWAAMATIIFGIILAAQLGMLLDAYTLDAIDGFIALNRVMIGIGMWLGTIMWYNG